VLIGSPFETGSKIKQLPSCAGKTTPVGQLAELARHFSIMRAAEAQPATPLSARWRLVPGARIAENGHVSEERFNRIIR